MSDNSNPPREIPNKEDPGKIAPEKDPNSIPDAEPGRNNPTNPKEDNVTRS